MQKWEYLELIVALDNRGVHYVQFINGQNVMGQNVPSFYHAITQFGEEGWELVNHYGESSLGTTFPHQSWVFKCPKP